jgi:hypothetical protein
MELKLKNCDVHACEAMCCHDGVYLEAEEESRLKQLVDSVPELRARLPEVYIVEGHWNGEHLGRKTATRPHDYRNPGYPTHFPRTRCVFADEQGFCELEKLARQRGEHPWQYKPFTCWMFPLEEHSGKAVPPPARALDDPYRVPGYPGYVSQVPCGRHEKDGRPWRQALERELQFFRRMKDA